MNGNADEFSVMEYISRKKKVDGQLEVLQRGLVNRDRKQSQKSKWKHPKNPTADDFPQFFNHSWNLCELLHQIYKEDIRIIKMFEDLGISTALANNSLFKAKTPEERIKFYTERSVDSNDEELLKIVLSYVLGEDYVAPDAHQIRQEILEVERPERFHSQNGTECSNSNSSESTKVKNKYIDYKGKNISLSKYVGVVKQRGDAKSSGSRNVHRFILASSEENNNQELGDLTSGSFIKSKSGHLIELLQLRRKGRTFIEITDTNSANDIYFLGTQYKYLSDKTYYSRPILIQRRYYHLKKFYRSRIIPERRWKEGQTHFIELKEIIDINENDLSLCKEASDENQAEDGSSYCFCRQASTLDNLIECSNKRCRIEWFHFSCVGLTKRTIPSGDWYCPRCRVEDHWCKCGQPEGEGGKQLIGCNCEDACKVEWYHLQCVGLYSVPVGDWFCDECVEAGDAPPFNGQKYCFCQRGSEFDTLVECTNSGCEIKFFHQCCIPEEDFGLDDWICSACL